MIAVALGSFLYPIRTLLPAFVPVNLVLSTYLVLRHRSGIDHRLLLRRIVPFMALGLPFGMLLFRASDDQHLKNLFGLFVCVLAAVELWRLARPAATERTLPFTVGAALLVMGGIAHGAFATGGPLAVYVTGRQLGDKYAFRSTLSALWLILNSVLVLSFALTGRLTLETGRLSLVCVCALLVGAVAGEWVHHRIGRRLFTSLIHTVLLLAGILLATAH